jgi:hypothetical protein
MSKPSRSAWKEPFSRPSGVGGCGSAGSCDGVEQAASHKTLSRKRVGFK